MAGSGKIVVALALLSGVSADVYTSTYNMKLSDTLPGNLLPQFKFQLGAIEGGSLYVNSGGGTGEPNPYVPFDTAPDEIWDHASTDLRAPSLPYLLQDQWTCDREDTDVPTIAYENDRLKVSITPQWGARIWSVYDKELERDWTFANPAHQPANIGVLKSWSAGGIEFNWSPGVIGHSVFAESPAYVGILETERGPVLRAYEYDRRNQSVWQADIYLPGADSTKVADAEDKLWIHPKVTNTQEVDLQGYWWTCVAVPAAPTTRVIVPAEWNLETSSDNSVGSPWPAFSMGNDNASFTGKDGVGLIDNSWLENIWNGDFFMGPLSRGESSVNYISYAEEEGFVGVHGHPLNGSKFFTWGQSGPGRFMQDFLGGLSGAESSDRSGDYAELQVGPAFTQFQTFDLPADTTLEWTEFFGAFNGDADTLHDENYSKPLGEVNDWLNENVNDTTFLSTDEWLKSIADTPLTSLMSSGSPWGAVEEIRRANMASVKMAKKATAEVSSRATRPGMHRATRQNKAGANSFNDDDTKTVSSLAPGLTFDHNAAWSNPETRPWCELAANGTFSDETLNSYPLSYQIGNEWMDLLVSSEDTFGGSWLHDLHIGIAMVEKGDDEAAARFKSSLSKKPLNNPVALRNLAVLSSSFDDAALDLYYQAFGNASMMASSDQDSGSSDDGDAVVQAAGARLLVNLGSELCVVLMQLSRFDDLNSFLNSNDFTTAVSLAPVLDTLDTVILSRVYVALRCSPADPNAALDLLTTEGALGCFPTLGKARSSLMSLWFEAQAQIVEASIGRDLMPIEARDNRVANPVPRNIGCPYASWSGANLCTYW